MDQLRVGIMVPKDVMKVAMGIERYEVLKPSQALFGGFLVAGVLAPTKVEDIPTENEGIGVNNGRLDGLLHQRCRTSSREHMQIGDKVGSFSSHGLVRPLSDDGSSVASSLPTCVGPNTIGSSSQRVSSYSRHYDAWEAEVRRQVTDRISDTPAAISCKQRGPGSTAIEETATSPYSQAGIL